jgi:hypothetical protein
MIYEILNDAGEVINTIVAEEWFVEQNYPGHYRLVGPEPQPYIEPIITKVAFRFRMTDAEYVGILSAAKTDVEVASWVETFNMVSTIDLDNQRTKDGMANLVSKNLLTQARADEILTAPVQPGERP